MGSYVDVFSGAIALAVVIYAILYRAVDALDVLIALRGFVHHDLILSFFTSSLRSQTRPRVESRYFHTDGIIMSTVGANYPSFFEVTDVYFRFIRPAFVNRLADQQVYGGLRLAVARLYSQN